ncbi:hypothetical protein PHYSODRAFT_337575 [Phytophthora sojae]|uniref:RxLR effector protein n=1 Tax=Phytophthora sojae (strain P6497) TaxID=1094619 RepID=G5A1K5_PHYSP|nr:hypothetical protein PHYSODRAFT_337575 [Phytophthora sojae]EGZ10803.1 hypothetical protein PHYSODRAFT_337575 [Phytophthora sojae]|eukprot:XP_009533548.1 hypothetical protein PHYSODRAFT_337575 [Phytophthora sojae]
MNHSRFFFVVAVFFFASLIRSCKGLNGVAEPAEIAIVEAKTSHRALTNYDKTHRRIRRLEKVPASEDDTVAADEEEQLLPVFSKLKSFFSKSPSSAISFEKNSAALKTLEQHPARGLANRTANEQPDDSDNACSGASTTNERTNGKRGVAQSYERPRWTATRQWTTAKATNREHTASESLDGCDEDGVVNGAQVVHGGHDTTAVATTNRSSATVDSMMTVHSGMATETHEEHSSTTLAPTASRRLMKKAAEPATRRSAPGSLDDSLWCEQYDTKCATTNNDDDYDTGDQHGRAERQCSGGAEDYGYGDYFRPDDGECSTSSGYTSPTCNCIPITTTYGGTRRPTRSNSASDAWEEGGDGAEDADGDDEDDDTCEDIGDSADAYEDGDDAADDGEALDEGRGHGEHDEGGDEDAPMGDMLQLSDNELMVAQKRSKFVKRLLTDGRYASMTVETKFVISSRPLDVATFRKHSVDTPGLRSTPVAVHLSLGNVCTSHLNLAIFGQQPQQSCVCRIRIPHACSTSKLHWAPAPYAKGSTRFSITDVVRAYHG